MSNAAASSGPSSRSPARCWSSSGISSRERATCHDLGWDYHLNRLNTGKKIRNHVRRLEALGLTVILTQAADHTDRTNPDSPSYVGVRCPALAQVAIFPVRAPEMR
ncbi:hypothetical protein GCM10020001_046670 [Nonomuraea salmonea]